MKRTDIAMLILIAAVSAGIAYFIASHVFGGMTEKGVTVKTVEKISSDVDAPDPKIFNENAINPSIEVNIGTNGGTTDTSTSSTSTSSTTTAPTGSGTTSTTDTTP